MICSISGSGPACDLVALNFKVARGSGFFFIPPKESCSQNKCFCYKLVKNKQTDKYIIVQKSASSSIKV